MTTTAQPALEGQVNYTRVGQDLLTLSSCWESLREILDKEIKRHGTMTAFATRAQVGHSAISRFYRRETGLTGLETLEKLVSYCKDQHPSIEDIALTVIEAKERVAPGLGPLSVRPPAMIRMWAELMGRIQHMGIHKSQITSQLKGYRTTMDNFLVGKPSLHNLLSIEEDWETIANMVSLIDWGNLSELKPNGRRSKSSRRKSRRKQTDRKPAPKPAGNTAVVTSNSDPAKIFEHLAVASIKRYGSIKAVVKKCEQTGIGIRRTAFQDALFRKKIFKAAEEFIQKAPSLLLGNAAVSPAPSEAVHTESPKMTAEVGGIANSKLFDEMFQLALAGLKTCLAMAVTASAEERAKILSNHQSDIDEVQMQLQAMQARNPMDVLGMLTENIETSSRATGKKSRGSR